MPTRTITATNTTILLTALGGVIAANDTVYVQNYGLIFTNGDLSTADLLLVHLTPGFTGTLAADNGGQLKLVVNQTSTGVFRNESSSPRVDVVSTSSTGVIYEVRNGPVSGGMFTLGTCKTTTFYQIAGPAQVKADVDLTTLIVVGGTIDVAQTSGAGVFPLTTLQSLGGVTTLARDVTTINLYGSSVVRLVGTDVTPATVRLDGGTLEVIESGTIASLTGTAGGAGVADFTNLRQPVTVTARSLGPGSTVRLRRAGVQPVFADTTGDVGGGPRIVYV